MWHNGVAVLDVRSAEVAVFIGERGVNNTFVFKASKTESYDGYENGAFYNVDGFSEAVRHAVSSVQLICGERIRELYIGVPGEFINVVPKAQDIGFSKQRKIGTKDLETLSDSGKEEMEGYTLIRASSMVYITADNRRVVDPVGISSTGLSGVISYFYCSNYFIEVLQSIFADMKINLHFLPTQLAMANYLIPSETRDDYAIFLDTGYLSSTVSVSLGNGILLQKTYWAGKGHIAFLLMQSFNLPYEAAVSLLGKANLYSKGKEGLMEFTHKNTTYEIPISQFMDTVVEGLDRLCEKVSEFLEECSGKELDYKILYVSGEGISNIRGALEHISKRLSRTCEKLVPDLPYYNKTTMSSRIALMDMAYEDYTKSKIMYRLINVLGG